MNRTVRLLIVAVAIAGIIYGSNTKRPSRVAPKAQSPAATGATAQTQATAQNGAAAARDLN